MKIAISGKGGVGKTTVAATLARMYAMDGRKVVAADADPDANLGLALGFPPELLAEIRPIGKMKRMAAERTGANESNTFLKLNPRVDDIPELYGREYNGVRLLIMGTVDAAGTGCVCPENVILKCLINSLILSRDEVVILDMEAGLEHLARGTTSCVDQFIVVIEPGARSVQTYHSVRRLAAELGVKRVGVVANKIRNAEDEQFVREQIPAEDLLGIVHFNSEVIDADRCGASPYDYSPSLDEEIAQIKSRLDSSAAGGVR